MEERRGLNVAVRLGERLPVDQCRRYRAVVYEWVCPVLAFPAFNRFE